MIINSGTLVLVIFIILFLKVEKLKRTSTLLLILLVILLFTVLPMLMNMLFWGMGFGIFRCGFGGINHITIM